MRSRPFRPPRPPPPIRRRESAPAAPVVAPTPHHVAERPELPGVFLLLLFGRELGLGRLGLGLAAGVFARGLGRRLRLGLGRLGLARHGRARGLGEGRRARPSQGDTETHRDHDAVVASSGLLDCGPDSAVGEIEDRQKGLREGPLRTAVPRRLVHPHPYYSGQSPPGVPKTREILGISRSAPGPAQPEGERGRRRERPQAKDRPVRGKPPPADFGVSSS